MNSDEMQPKVPPGRTAGMPKYGAGARRSVGRLAHLGYDPIGELVKNYRKLELEIDRQEKIRDGIIVELTSQGKPRAYRAEVHHALYDKMIAIGDKLLRYGYGRVPEQAELERTRPTPMIVNLTKKGEQYIINSGGDDEQPQGDIDEWPQEQ